MHLVTRYLLMRLTLRTWDSTLETIEPVLLVVFAERND